MARLFHVAVQPNTREISLVCFKEQRSVRKFVVQVFLPCIAIESTAKENQTSGQHLQVSQLKVEEMRQKKTNHTRSYRNMTL
jgi:hypothetical protein